MPASKRTNECTSEKFINFARSVQTQIVTLNQKQADLYPFENFTSCGNYS